MAPIPPNPTTHPADPSELAFLLQAGSAALNSAEKRTAAAASTPLGQTANLAKAKAGKRKAEAGPEDLPEAKQMRLEPSSPHRKPSGESARPTTPGRIPQLVEVYVLTTPPKSLNRSQLPPGQGPSNGAPVSPESPEGGLRVPPAPRKSTDPGRQLPDSVRRTLDYL